MANPEYIVVGSGAGGGPLAAQDRYEVGIVAQASEPFGLLSDATFKGPVPAEAKSDDPLFEQ